MAPAPLDQSPVTRRVRTATRRAAVLLATAGLLAGALGPGAIAASAADPVVFKFGMTRQPTGMNVLYAGSWAQGLMAYEPLVGVQRATPDYEFPLFAESWSSNADATVWTFKISPDLKWSDGQPATAKDVVFTYTYLKSAVGTKWSISTLANLDAIKEVKAIDDQTVEFTLTGPADILTTVLNNSQIIPEHIWGKLTLEQASTFDAMPNVGTGPFIPVEWKQGQYVRFEKNKYFRGPGPGVDEAIMVLFSTPDAEAQALKAGEIDLAFDIPLASYDQLASDPKIHPVGATLGAYQALSFNQLTGKGAGSTPALLDQKFRDALGYAIDKQALVDKVLGGHGKVMDSLATGFAGDFQQPMTGIERTFDLDKAKQLLDAAGYADSNGDGVREDKNGKPLELSLLVQQGAQMATAAQYVAEWFSSVGVKITANAVDDSTFYAKAFSLAADGGGGWDLTIEQTYQNPWPGDFLVWWTTPKLGVMNASHWTNPQYDALVSQVLTTADGAKLHDLSNQALRLLYTESPIIPLYENYWLQAYRTDKFEGWTGCGAPDGLVAYCMPPELTFYNIRPIGTGASAEPSTDASANPASAAPAASSAATPAASSAPASSGDGGNTGVLVGGAVIVLVVVVGGALLLRRRSAA